MTPGERVRRWLADDTEATLITVAQLDAEIFSGLARLHRAGQLEADEVDERLRRLARLDVGRVPMLGATRDLECALLTTDQRLARAVPDLAIELDG